MNARSLAILAAALTAIAVRADDAVERGRYMVLTGHCNNCHTAGYAPKEGAVPESEWLLGSAVLGYRGPWGTTYATNLRATAAGLDEDAWVRYMKALKTRPPMPFWSINAISEADLRAMYRYIRGLGPAGEPVLKFVPPGEEPKPPFVQWPMPPK